MRKLRLMAVLLTLALLTSAAQAQDLIVLSDGSSIPAKVLEITQAEVKYKKASNPDGPTYTTAVQGIDYIKFENGTTETFGKQQAQKASESDADISNPYANTYIPPSGITKQQPQQGLSDSKLLQQHLEADYQKYIKRAKLYKKIAWIGLGVCTIVGIYSRIQTDSYRSTANAFMFASFGVGVVWCTSFLVAANYQKKKANEARYMFGSLAQIPVLNANGKQLSASVDMFRDRMTHNTSLGLGLKFTF